MIHDDFNVMLGRTERVEVDAWNEFACTVGPRTQAFELFWSVTNPLENIQESTARQLRWAYPHGRVE